MPCGFSRQLFTCASGQRRTASSNELRRLTAHVCDGVSRLERQAIRRWPKFEQMLGDDGRRLLFVGFDRIGDRRIVIDHGDRHASLDELRKVMVVRHAERRPHDQAVHAAIEQAVDLPQALGLVLFEVGHVAEAADPDGDRQVVGCRRARRECRTAR